MRGDADAVAAWAAKGLVATRVVELDGWTAACAVEPESRVAAPYDNALSVLAARPLRRALRPGIGFFVIDGRAVVTVQQPRWRRQGHQWLVWSRGRGPLQTPRLSPVPPAHLVRVARPRRRPAPEDLEAALHTRDGSALDWLTALMDLLQLPGRDLLHDPDTPVGELVEPDWRSVMRFESLMTEEELIRQDSVPPSRRGLG